MGVYGKLLEGRERLHGEADAWSRTVLEAGERLLADVEAGKDEFEAWAWRVMQEQVPMLRTLAGLDAPDEREAEIRERYGVPEPARIV